MMGGWLVHVDLAKNRSGVLDPVLTPQPKPITPNVFCE
jgi:hypothetical protein